MNTKAEQCSTLDDLFLMWKNKEPQTITVQDKNRKDIGVRIDHTNNVFVSDGIVNRHVWDSLKTPKILFVLKEAYNKDDASDWPLTEWINRGECLNHKIWRRIALWSYGMMNTTDTTICPYTASLSTDTSLDYLRKIAVLNLKKSNGRSSSDYYELEAYSKADREEIMQEIKLINPDVIVCGSVFEPLYSNVYSEKIKENEKSDNWYYYQKLGRKRLLIDYYHPANRWPELLNYYGLMGIFQQAQINSEWEDLQNGSNLKR